MIAGLRGSATAYVTRLVADIEIDCIGWNAIRP
jgi:hypothetical protein